MASLKSGLLIKVPRRAWQAGLQLLSCRPSRPAQRAPSCAWQGMLLLLTGMQQVAGALL